MICGKGNCYNNWWSDYENNFEGNMNDHIRLVAMAWEVWPGAGGGGDGLDWEMNR